MKRILLVLPALSVLASACVTAPKVREAEVTPPPAFESPKPAAPGVSAAALDRWWTLYNDAQLQSLVELALANSPDAKDALSKLEQAGDIRKATLDQLYIPQSTLSGTAAETYTNVLAGLGGPGAVGGVFQNGAATTLNGNFNVSWELDLFGRRAAGRQTANADFFTAAFTYEATRTSLAANVAQSLFQARGLALQLRDAEEIARADHELARTAELKYQHGLSAQGDADQAAATAQSADAQAESLRAQLVAARRTLLVLIGKGFDPLDSLKALPEVGALPPVPDQVPGDLLRRRPDVRAAEWRITSAKGLLKTDQLALLPTLKLQPGVLLTDTSGPFGVTTAAWSISGNLTAPVLDRPRLIAQMHAQGHVAEQDVIAYEKAVQTAYGDAENAFVFLDSDKKRVDMLLEAEKRAQSAYEKARVAYGQGLTDLTAALQAENTWRNIRTQRSSAQAVLMQRSVQVFKALGGGWAPEAPGGQTPYAGLAARADEGGR